MPYVDSIILGLVQGITEFLPISSSGHIFLAETWMGLVPDVDLSLWLHLGSLLAVIGYFWKDLWRMSIGCLQMVQENRMNNHAMYTIKLLVATLATLPVAIVVHNLFPHSELSLGMVGITLIVTAGLIVASERWNRPQQSFTWMVVIVLGLVQGLSILPGISRSGLTIALLIWLGVSRQLAARTSFLLSIPTILGAGLYTYIQQGERFVDLGWFEIVAVATSAVSAYVAIAWMMRWVEGRWIYFAYYCFGLGILTIIL